MEKGQKVKFKRQLGAMPNPDDRYFAGFVQEGDTGIISHQHDIKHDDGDEVWWSVEVDKSQVVFYETVNYEITDKLYVPVDELMVEVVE